MSRKNGIKSAPPVFMNKMLKRYGQAEAVVTDRIQSYTAAMRESGNLDLRDMGRWAENRAESLTFSSDEGPVRCCGSDAYRSCKSSRRSTPNSTITSILIVTSSIAKPSRYAVHPHWSSGSPSPAERRDQSPIYIVERRVRERLTAPC